MRALQRARHATLAAAAVVLAAAFGIGLASDGPATHHRPANQNGGVDRYEAWVACSRYIVTGDVTAVRAATTDGRAIVSLAAQDWLKPSHGSKAAEFEVADPTALEAEPLQPGEHVMVVVADEERQSRTYSGAELKGARRAVERALPTAPAACPSHWSTFPDA